MRLWDTKSPEAVSRLTVDSALMSKSVTTRKVGRKHEQK